MPDARSTSPLIEPAELAELLGRDAVTVLDVRYRLGGPPGAQEHARGHVPGAAYVDLDRDLAAPPAPDGAGGRHPLPDAGAFEEAMRSAGVDAERPVVVYDDWSGRAAARAWWLLRHHGHDDVRVLDGGWSAWVAGGGAVETGGVHPAPGDFSAGPGRLPVVDAVSLQDADVVVDAREPARFRGETEPVDPVAGHVPGAVNAPTSANLDDGGRLRDPAELRELFAAAGVGAEVEVAVYCGSGVTATHDLLALAVAGLDAALYPGSWSDWVADPGRPVERSARDGSLVVRRATSDDVPALVALGAEVWPVAYDFDPDYARVTVETWWTPEALGRTVASTTWMVVERDGRVVAAGNVDLRPEPPAQPVVWILAVLPDEQGRGLGRLLLRGLVRHAGDRGVGLSYVAGNAGAAGFYARLGFTETGREAAADGVPEHVEVGWRPTDGGPLATDR